jgi:hypothetical protein
MTCPDTNVWHFMYDRDIAQLEEAGVRVRHVDADDLDPPAVYVRCGIEPLLRVSGLWWAHVQTHGDALLTAARTRSGRRKSNKSEERGWRVGAPAALLKLASIVLREERDDGLPQHMDYLAASVDWKQQAQIAVWQMDAYLDVLETLRGYRDVHHTMRFLSQLNNHGRVDPNFLMNRYRLVDGGLPWTQR